MGQTLSQGQGHCPTPLTTILMAQSSAQIGHMALAALPPNAKYASGKAGLTVILLAGPCQQPCPAVNFMTVLSSASPAQVPRLVLELPSFWNASLKGHTEYVYLSTCKGFARL